MRGSKNIVSMARHYIPLCVLTFLGYYNKCFLKSLGWLRNRLQYCIWHHWKKRERKRKNLIRLGVKTDNMCSWSRTRMGGWAEAQSPILNTTITVDRLTKSGKESMST
jgi:RNA-directed DNA polymerase